MSEDYALDRGYVVYPQAVAPDPAAKAPPVDHGDDLIPVERYYSQAEADLEWEHMWKKTWLWAGVTHDLAKVGDYFKYDVGRESFVIIRSAPDCIQAFYNVCPHRGNYLVYDDYGSIKQGASLYCKFHGWRFNLDGSLREIKDAHTFPEKVICDVVALQEVRCEIWNSLVFINLDPEAIPLQDYLDVIPEHCAPYDFSRMRIINEMVGVIDANWKTAIEAFIEFYHADDTHPQVLPFSATLRTQYDLYRNGMSRMIIPNGYSGDRTRDPDTVPDALKGLVAFFGGKNDDYVHLNGRQYQAALADTLRKWAARNGHGDLFDRLTDGQVTDDWNYHVFPTITLNVFSHSLLIQSWTPHPSDPEKHVYRALSLTLPVSDPNQPVMDLASYTVANEPGWTGAVRPPRVFPKTDADWGTVLGQDIERLHFVQRGLRSGSFKGLRLSQSECRVRHYLAEIDRYLGR